MSCDLDRSQPMSAVAALTQRAFGHLDHELLGDSRKRQRKDPIRPARGAVQLHALRVAVVRTRHLFAWGPSACPRYVLSRLHKGRVVEMELGERCVQLQSRMSKSTGTPASWPVSGDRFHSPGALRRRSLDSDAM